MTKKNQTTSDKQAQPAGRKARRKATPEPTCSILCQRSQATDTGEGTDQFGRKFILDNWPQSFYLEAEPDATKMLKFTLQPLSKDQTQTMVFQSGPYTLDTTTGSITMENGNTQKVCIDPDGTEVIETQSAEGKLIELFNADGAPSQRVAVFASGLVINEMFNTEGQLGEIATLEIKHPDGRVASFTKADTANPLYMGQLTDSKNNVIEKALWNPSSELIKYKDMQGNATRAEMYERGKGDKPMPTLTEGKYDRNREVFISAHPVFPDQYRVIWIGQGRTETWLADGQKTWEDAVNSNAYAVVRPLRKGQSFCEAEVNNEDGTGARLYADNSIECWNSEELFDREQLPKQLLHFVVTNAGVDRRDVAEFYRQYRTRQKDMLYVIAKLGKFNSAKRLTNEQRQALIATELHDIAFPRDIYQGLLRVLQCDHGSARVDGKAYKTTAGQYGISSYKRLRHRQIRQALQNQRRQCHYCRGLRQTDILSTVPIGSVASGRTQARTALLHNA